MITTLAELNDDIMEAYAKARAAMEKLELTHGVSISRGASLAYKTALERAFTERDFESGDMASWPAMVEQISSFITDIRSEYARLYEVAFGDDARDQIEQVTGNLESLDDTVRRTVHWGQEAAEDAVAGLSLVEEHRAIKDAYRAAMRAMQEAAEGVEKWEGRDYRCALGGIVSDTCEIKNLGHSIQYNQNERRETALLILDMVASEYDDLYYRADFPEDDKYQAARDAIHELRRTVSEHLPKEDR
jgi:hypothetical protein